MRRRERNVQLPPPLEAGVDRVLAQEPLHLVQVLATDTGELPRLVQPEVRDRELVRVVDRLADDAGIAPARSVSGHALLDDTDRERGIELLEEERRPEPCESCSDDRHIRMDVARERDRFPRRPRGHPVAGLLDGEKRHGKG